MSLGYNDDKHAVGTTTKLLLLLIGGVWIASFAIAYVKGCSDHDFYMFFSNASLLIPATLNALIGFHFDCVLWIGSFIFSNAYHVCHSYVMDQIESPLGSMCSPLSMRGVYWTLVFDSTFASLIGVSAFIKLMPNRYAGRLDAGVPRDEYIRIALTAFAAPIIFIAHYFSTFQWSEMSIYRDQTHYVFMAVSIYVVFLFVCHLIVVYRQNDCDYHLFTRELKNYYKKHFNTHLLLASLGLLCVAILLWGILQTSVGALLSIQDTIEIHSFGQFMEIIAQYRTRSLYVDDSYFPIHSLWHYADSIAGILFIFSYRYGVGDDDHHHNNDNIKMIHHQNIIRQTIMIIPFASLQTWRSKN